MIEETKTKRDLNCHCCGSVYNGEILEKQIVLANAGSSVKQRSYSECSYCGNSDGLKITVSDWSVAEFGVSL